MPEFGAKSRRTADTRKDKASNTGALNHVQKKQTAFNETMEVGGGGMLVGGIENKQ